MTDRELLELAAKAAGLRIKHYNAAGTPCITPEAPEWPFPREWNPLTDDGDALRLAVKIGLVVCVMREPGFTGVYLPAEHIGGKYDEVERHDSDPNAATRRAIVRAAAALAPVPLTPDDPRQNPQAIGRNSGTREDLK
jgi:hypothetical protein